MTSTYAPTSRWIPCPIDGTPIDTLPPHGGRRAEYCSAACKQKAYRQRQIPARLRSADRWVRWSLRGGRKLPLRADSNRAASVSDPRTWSSYAIAKRSEVGEGVGFVLGGGVGAIDLDGCLDAEGQPSALAAAVLAANPGAWVERSMSGYGLHIFGLLAEAPGRRTKGLEVYSRGRFIAMTGDTRQVGSLKPLTLP